MSPGPPRRLSWRQLFTVEPVIFFYAYGLFMHLPIIQQYIYFRVSKAKGFLTHNSSHSNGCGQDIFNKSTEMLEKEVYSLTSCKDTVASLIIFMREIAKRFVWMINVPVVS